MADEISIPADINPKVFFEELLPQVAPALLEANPIPGMEGTEFAVSFDLSGDGGGVWSIITQDAKQFQVINGPYENAQVEVAMSVDDWREGLLQGSGMDLASMTSQSAKLPGRSQYEALKRTKGFLTVELKRDDGSNLTFNVKFNRADTPTLKIMMDMNVFIEINSGQANPQQLFMQGKVKLQGDMTIAMNLAAMMPR